LPRAYQLTENGHLIIKPARVDEHWSVDWEHCWGKYEFKSLSGCTDA
jgi:hypothetical protein